jgi:hypothetical protein
VLRQAQHERDGFCVRLICISDHPEPVEGQAQSERGRVCVFLLAKRSALCVIPNGVGFAFASKRSAWLRQAQPERDGFCVWLLCVSDRPAPVEGPDQPERRFLFACLRYRGAFDRLRPSGYFFTSKNGIKGPLRQTLSNDNGITTDPSKNFVGPAALGLMSKSKICVGSHKVAHAFGTSTTPLMWPCTGAVPRIE